MIWDFQFHLPTTILFGQGKIGELGERIRQLGGSKVFLVTDKGLVKAGIVDQVTALLKNAELEYVVFDEVLPNPRDTDCHRAAAVAREHGVDMLVGLGGGSAMDTAKAVGTLLTHEGHIRDFYGVNKLERPITPLICVPTTAGTGSEATSFSVITDTETKVKECIFDGRIAPKAAILDPELTISMPKSITAATGMDALTHAIEAYVCTIADPITDALALYAIETIVKYLPLAVENGSDLEARKQMLVGSLIAGMAFGNSDLGGVHAMAEPLGGLYDTPHGVANAMFLPIVFAFNISADVHKHAIVAQRLGVNPDGKTLEETALAGADLLKKLSERIGIPKLKDLGYVNPDDFEFLAEGATKNICNATNPRKAKKEDYLQLFHDAYAQ